MSLINDVLEQIDARAPVVEPERVAIEPSHYAYNTRKIFTLSPGVKIAALAVCGFLTGYAVQALVQSPAKPEPPLLNLPQVAHLSPLNNPPAGIEATIPAASVEAAHEVSLTGQLNPVNLLSAPQVSVEETALLAQANQYILADRLTFPPLQNAYQVYRELLIKNPSHPAALDGIARIKQRYLALTAEAIAQGAREKALRYIERAEFVGVDKQELNNLREQLPLSMPMETAAITEQKNKVQEPVSVPISNVASTALSTPAEPVRTNLINPPVTRLSAIDKNANAAGVSEAAFLAGLAEDKSSEQQALVFIKSRDNSVDTVRWLARRWVNAQEWLPLLDLMTIPSALNSTEREVFRAQALLGLKNYPELISWLQGINNLQQPELQRILAVALQKTGREADALGIYQHLVALHPKNSGLWLAVGLSADNLGNHTLAREAFFRAQQIGGHSKTVNDFLSRKLAAATP
ncbi:MAG TPA: hypothetical protein PK129_02135 [Cellvibrionaceae bacterium]|nr:hypothetical protein [Cellvibrionaceae bacterium]